MIKIFYNETSGMITSKVITKWDWESDLTHINIENDINESQYTVNPQTKQLVYTPRELPKRPTRVT